MMGKLDLIEPVEQQRHWFIPLGRKLSIGRDESNTARLQVKGISRRHARVRFSVRRNAWTVKDLGSTNGTFVNGEAIRGRAFIKNGDTIRAGRAVFKFTVL